MIAFNHSELSGFLQSTYLARHLVAPSTVESYEGTVSLFAKFSGPTLDLADITPEEIGRFLGWLRHTQKRKTNTIRKHRRQLMTMLREARRAKDPATKSPYSRIKLSHVAKVKKQKTLPRAWTPQQFETVIDDASTNLTGYVGRYPLRVWFPSLCLTAWSADWRIGACMALESSRVNIETGAIVSRESKGDEERCAWLTTEALEAMRKIWDPRRREVYGDWIHDRGSRQWPTLNKILKGIIQRTGVPDIGRFHTIRRTSTTAVAVKHGIDAAAQHAGHSNPQITIDSYVDQSHLKPAESKLPALNLTRRNQLRLF